MSKYFLGEAANYATADLWRHLFAFGTKKDSAALRTRLAERYDVPSSHIALTSNGRSAIYLALKALVPRGSKIIINGFTCQAVAEAVTKASCIPIYADIEPSSLHFDLSTLSHTLEHHPDARAIIIQNTLGIPCDKRVYSYAKRHQLIIIEDFAHMIGSSLEGNAAALSFGKGKAIDTITGGALILKSSKAPTLEKKPSFGASVRARFYPFFGVLLRALIPHYPYKILLGLLLKVHLIERSADAPLLPHTRLAHWQAKLVLAKLTPGQIKVKRSHLLVSDRQTLLKKLQKSGYFFDEIWYDVPISPARNYAHWHFPEEDCPVATKISRQIINLPTFYPHSSLAPALKIIKDHQHE